MLNPIHTADEIFDNIHGALHLHSVYVKWSEGFHYFDEIESIFMVRNTSLLWGSCDSVRNKRGNNLSGSFSASPTSITY